MIYDPNKIIQIAEYLKKKNIEPGEKLNKGIEILNSLSDQDRSKVIDFMLAYVFMELRYGLGLVDDPDDAEPIDIEDLLIFNAIADIYEEAAGDCYFCSRGIDPNEDEFGPDVKLCVMCKMKLGNFTEALGISAGSVFPGMDRRFVQKKRIVGGVEVDNGPKH